MNKIIYKKGDIFSVAGPDRVIAHACNCKGVWGSGIAIEFKKRYPEAFNDYKVLCDTWEELILGISQVSSGKNKIGFMFTSNGYGSEKDSEEKILESTKTAVASLLCMMPDTYEIHTPKINSGKFSVPWEKTEAIINEALKHTKHKWYVWSIE